MIPNYPKKRNISRVVEFAGGLRLDVFFREKKPLLRGASKVLTACKLEDEQKKRLCLELRWIFWVEIFCSNFWFHVLSHPGGLWCFLLVLYISFGVKALLAFVTGPHGFPHAGREPLGRSTAVAGCTGRGAMEKQGDAALVNELSGGNAEFSYEMMIYPHIICIPRTQMTIVLIEKGLVLEG